MKTAAKAKSDHKSSSDAVWLRMMENMVYLHKMMESLGFFQADEGRIRHPLEKAKFNGSFGANCSRIEPTGPGAQQRVGSGERERE